MLPAQIGIAYFSNKSAHEIRKSSNHMFFIQTVFLNHKKVYFHMRYAFYKADGLPNLELYSGTSAYGSMRNWRAAPCERDSEFFEDISFKGKINIKSVSYQFLILKYIVFHKNLLFIII